MPKPYRYLRLWLLPFIRSRIWTVRGLENLPTSGGFILAPNHQAWVDSAIVGAAVYRHLNADLRFVAQSRKYGNLGGIPIDDYDKRKVIDITRGYLQAGHPVVIFPEGNSNTNPELRSGKTGAARLGLRSGLPVIPVGVKGTKGVRAWQGVLWFFSIWRPCHVILGQPLIFTKTEITDNNEELLRQTTAEIMRHISAVSGKSMPGELPVGKSRGFIWFFVWRFIRPLIQWRIRAKGTQYLPDKGPFIVAANHASYFDPPTLAMAVMHATGLQPLFPTKEAIARTFFRIVGQKGLGVLGMLTLDNTDRSKVLNNAVDYLKRGGVIGIFPEGTRNKPTLNPRWQTDLLKGKTGAVRLMLTTGAPIIPAVIKVPKGIGIGQALFNTLMFWKLFRVEFGPPIRFENLPNGEPTKEDLDRLTKQLMIRIADLSQMNYPY